MKVSVTALEVYETVDGKEQLVEVKILGDEDSSDREVCVSYEGITDMAELKEVMKGWGEAARMQYFGQAVEKGHVLIQMDACHLPRKLGATRVSVVTKEVEW
jgi:hypothetical protein